MKKYKIQLTQWFLPEKNVLGDYLLMTCYVYVWNIKLVCRVSYHEEGAQNLCSLMNLFEIFCLFAFPRLYQEFRLVLSACGFCLYFRCVKAAGYTNGDHQKMILLAQVRTRKWTHDWFLHFPPWCIWVKVQRMVSTLICRLCWEG